MTKLMDEAINSLRFDVPPEHQDDIARIVMQITGKEQSVHRLTSEEQIDHADAEIERGEFATDAEVRAVWAKDLLTASASAVRPRP